MQCYAVFRLCSSQAHFLTRCHALPGSGLTQTPRLIRQCGYQTVSPAILDFREQNPGILDVSNYLSCSQDKRLYRWLKCSPSKGLTSVLTRNATPTILLSSKLTDCVTRTICTSQQRQLKRKRKRPVPKQKAEEDIDEEDEGADDELEEGEMIEEEPEQDEYDSAGNIVTYKDITLSVTSARMDNVLGHAGFPNISRHKVEDLFYDSKIRLNGETATKKSIHLNVDDIADIIKEVSEIDSEMFKVMRIKVLDITDKPSGSLAIKVRRYKQLTVDYSID